MFAAPYHIYQNGYEYGLPAYQQPQQALNPFLPATVQPAPVASSFQKHNNRRKWQGAAQDAVICPVLRAALPGQQWILGPAQPSGNEVCTAGASEAQPPQPGWNHCPLRRVNIGIV